MTRFVFSLAAASILFACGPSSPVANGANDTDALPGIDDEQPDPTAAAPKNAAALDAPGQPASAGPKIPAAFHGRWGLSPTDCTSAGRGSDGLLVIGPDELRFYESVASPKANVKADPDSIRGDFRFTGEGQEWTKFITLRLQGQKLVRTESKPAASFSYAKCN